MKAEDLAAVIREAIHASGKSAGQLAAASTVHKAVIARFLREDRSITVETAGKLLAALGCEVEIRGPKADTPPAAGKAARHRAGKAKSRKARPEG
jgi:ribosome-binding protein aMBF1 (putative translation factor)